MSKYQERRLKKWEGVRTKGKRRFVIFNGVFGWGILTGILFFLFMLVFESGAGHYLATLATDLIIFMTGGILFGHLLWNMNEKFYQKHIIEIVV